MKRHSWKFSAKACIFFVIFAFMLVPCYATLSFAQGSAGAAGAAGAGGAGVGAGATAATVGTVGGVSAAAATGLAAAAAVGVTAIGSTVEDDDVVTPATHD